MEDFEIYDEILTYCSNNYGRIAIKSPEMKLIDNVYTSNDLHKLIEYLIKKTDYLMESPYGAYYELTSDGERLVRQGGYKQFVRREKERLYKETKDKENEIELRETTIAAQRSQITYNKYSLYLSVVAIIISIIALLISIFAIK